MLRSRRTYGDQEPTGTKKSATHPRNTGTPAKQGQHSQITDAGTAVKRKNMDSAPAES